MAQRVSIVLVDDLDGTEADETVTFGLDGTTYEIDLHTKNAEHLRKALGKYTPAARKVSASRSRRTVSSTSPVPTDVRKWAKDNGIEVGPTGRIPKSVVKQYEEANA